MNSLSLLLPVLLLYFLLVLFLFILLLVFGLFLFLFSFINVLPHLLHLLVLPHLPPFLPFTLSSSSPSSSLSSPSSSSSSSFYIFLFKVTTSNHRGCACWAALQGRNYPDISQSALCRIIQNLLQADAVTLKQTAKWWLVHKLLGRN